jgi:hypothetical protein
MFKPHYHSRQQLPTKPSKGKPKRRCFESIRKLRYEALEDRRVLALVGVAPLDLPTIGYDSGGTVSYENVSNQFSLSATPLNISTHPFALFSSGSLNIRLTIDEAGGLVGGVAGDDLVLTGEVDLDGDFNTDASGVLLTGEISTFGFEDSGGSTDLFDFRFVTSLGSRRNQHWTVSWNPSVKSC